MAYIFMDESGDLGFSLPPKGRSSQYFLITIMMVEDKKAVQKAVKAVHRGLKKKFLRYSAVLHAYHENQITKKRLLEKISKLDIKIMTIYLNKSKVYTNLRSEKNVLYNYVTNILLDRICTKKIIPIDEKIQLIVERKDTNKFLNLNFSNYLKKQSLANHKLNIEIKIRTSYQEKCLQATDFISWSIFRKYESNDEYYYNLIKEKIFEENSLF